MLTRGQSKFLNQNINSFIALMFVGTVALLAGLVIWQTASGENPLAQIFINAAKSQSGY